MIHARPSRPSIPVIHTRVMVSDFIHNKSKEWDVKMLENVIVSDDILLLIQSSSVNQSTEDDKFC